MNITTFDYILDNVKDELIAESVWKQKKNLLLLLGTTHQYDKDKNELQLQTLALYLKMLHTTLFQCSIEGHYARKSMNHT
jgi:hypothetical protein